MRTARIGITGAVAGMLLRDPCAYCGGPAVELDHVVAVARGGANDVSNITAACRTCNAQKKDMDLLRFMLARPLFAQLDRTRGELATLRLAA